MTANEEIQGLRMRLMYLQNKDALTEENCLTIERIEKRLAELKEKETK